jgi:hypothetical protein
VQYQRYAFHVGAGFASAPMVLAVSTSRCASVVGTVLHQVRPREGIIFHGNARVIRDESLHAVCCALWPWWSYRFVVLHQYLVLALGRSGSGTNHAGLPWGCVRSGRPAPVVPSASTIRSSMARGLPVQGAVHRFDGVGAFRHEAAFAQFHAGLLQGAEDERDVAAVCAVVMKCGKSSTCTPW